MASSLQYYTITITNGISNTTPSDGFVDNQTIQGYYGLSSTPYPLETTPSGLTLGLCEAKRRGNVRYAEIIRQIELISNVMINPASIIATGGTALLEPTAFSFQLVAQDSAFVTHDELNPGATLSSLACITRCIARALTAPTMNRAIDVYDPTPSTSVGVYGASTSVPRFGARIFVANSQGINAFSPGFQIGPYANSIATADAHITVAMLTAY